MNALSNYKNGERRLSGGSLVTGSEVGPQAGACCVNTTDSENVDDTSHMIDMLSNGFKMRGTSGQENANNGIYVFFAFAEQSMKYANAK